MQKNILHEKKADQERENCLKRGEEVELEE
jgi:hypothetical protein